MRFLRAGSRRIEVLALATAASLGLITAWWVLSGAAWAVLAEAETALIILGGGVTAVVVAWFLPSALDRALVFWSSFGAPTTLRKRFVWTQVYAIFAAVMWAVVLLNLLASHKT